MFTFLIPTTLALLQSCTVLIPNNFYLKVFLCIVYFWHHWAPKWMQFPVSVNYKILNILRFMHSPTFSYKIQFWTTFTCSFFWYDAYFYQQWDPKWIQFPISLHCKSAQETKYEYYEMLQTISTHLVGYCLFMYFRDETATVISWIWVELVGIGKILPEIWFYGIYRYFVLQL